MTVSFESCTSAAEWLDNVREADEDSLLALADHLPAEAAEALLELATGGKPAAAEVPPAVLPPFEHPDAQRRFRVVTKALFMTVWCPDSRSVESNCGIPRG